MLTEVSYFDRINLESLFCRHTGLVLLAYSPKLVIAKPIQPSIGQADSMNRDFVKTAYAILVMAMCSGFQSIVDAQQPITVRISSERAITSPISPLITGNFIERSIGRQVDGMWAEMIYNRTFQENIPPFTPAVWGWLQMDPEHYNGNAPFWHSGYEQNDWELINPAASSKRRTLGEESHLGKGSLIVNNESEGTPAGMKQKGIYLEQNREYLFSIFGGYYTGWGLKTSPSLDGFPPVYEELLKTKTITVSLVTETTGKTIFSKNLNFASTQQQFDMKFTPEGFTGRATLEISFHWKGELLLSWCSLMPADNQNGWRKEVVEALREIGPPVIRFPGGCFASFDRWQDAIGPRNHRVPRAGYFWGGLESNEVGIDEFLSLCEMIDCQPQITINMMTGSPLSASELVDYCNGTDASCMGRLRKENGIQRTTKVTYWEMDNENGRKWSALQYAGEINRFAVAMREVDPDIRIMMDIYSFPYELEWLPQMLEVAGRQVDYVITRERSVDYIQQVMKILDECNRKNQTHIGVVNTEWIADANVSEPFSISTVPLEHDWSARNIYEQGLSYRQIRWFYALSSASTILDFMSLGGTVHLANFNNCANTWGGNIIECSKEGIWKSANGEVFTFYKDFKDRYPLRSDVKNENRLVRILACETEDGIILNVVNKSEKAASLKLTLPDGYRPVSLETLYAPDKLSRTYLDHTDLIYETNTLINTRTAEIKPLSVNRFVYRKK